MQLLNLKICGLLLLAAVPVFLAFDLQTFLQHRKKLITLAHLEGYELYKNKTKEGYVRTCYYPWTDDNSTLQPDQIDLTLCTHIIHGFSSIDNNTIQPQYSKGYTLTPALKEKDPNLKVMLTVGGGGDLGLSYTIKTAENRQMLITDVINLLRKYNFDGFDIDWEFPAWGGSPMEDKPNFVTFLKEFRQAIENESQKSGKSPLLLSLAVAAPLTIIKASYDIPGIAPSVDWINIMCYDYHSYSWYMPATGHNAPLFPRRDEVGYFRTLNTAWSANYWAANGMPKSKILVGLPTYGHSYKLADPTRHGFDAPAIANGMGGGDATYPEICDLLKNGGTRNFDDDSQVPYCYKDYDWIGYDDEISLAAKAKWVKSQGFRGIMTFDLNCDDWQGTCDGKTKFPLHKVIRDILP